MASRSVSAPMRILVIRLSAMGDVAMSVPVVGALRKQYPEAQIVVLTPAFLQPFFRGFFDLIVVGRRDYALMTEALLVKPV